MQVVIPVDHGLRRVWFSSESKTVPSKSLMRMRMQDSYKEVNPNFLRTGTASNASQMVFSPLPNMIQYRPEGKVL